MRHDPALLRLSRWALALGPAAASVALWAPDVQAIPSPESLVAVASGWPWALAGLATVAGLGAAVWVALTRQSEPRMRRLTAASLLLATVVAVGLLAQTAARLGAEQLGEIATEFRCDLEAHEARAAARTSRPDVTWQRFDLDSVVRQSQGEHAPVVRADVRLPVWVASRPVPGFPVVAMQDLAARLRAARGEQPVLFLISYRQDPLQHLGAAQQAEVWSALKRYHRVVQAVVGRGSEEHVEALRWPIVKEGFLVDESAVAFDGATTLLTPGGVADLATDGETVLVAPYNGGWRDGPVYEQEFLARYLPEAWQQGRVVPVDYGAAGRDRRLPGLLERVAGRRFACVGYTKFDCGHFGLDFAWRASELARRSDTPFSYLGGMARLPEVAATLALRERSAPHRAWRALRGHVATALHHLAEDRHLALLWLGLLIGLVLAPLRWVEARSRRAVRSVDALGSRLWVRRHRRRLEALAGRRPGLELLGTGVTTTVLGLAAAAALEPAEPTAPLLGVLVWLGLALPGGAPRTWPVLVAHLLVLVLVTQLPESAAWLLAGAAAPAAGLGLLAAGLPGRHPWMELGRGWSWRRDVSRPGELVLQPDGGSPVAVSYWTGERPDGAEVSPEQRDAFLAARLTGEPNTDPRVDELDRLAELADGAGLVGGPLTELLCGATPLTASVMQRLYRGSGVEVVRAFGRLMASAVPGAGRRRLSPDAALARLDAATGAAAAPSTGDPRSIATALESFAARFGPALMAASRAHGTSKDARLSGPSRGAAYVLARLELSQGGDPAAFSSRWGHRRSRDWELASRTWDEDPTGAALTGSAPSAPRPGEPAERLRELARDEALRALAEASAGLEALATDWGVSREELCELTLEELSGLTKGDAARAGALVEARRKRELVWPGGAPPDPLTLADLAAFTWTADGERPGQHLGAPVAFSGIVGVDVVTVERPGPELVTRFGDSTGTIAARGGRGSHAASVARELGYPIVRIDAGALPPVGSTVEVDASGRVRVVTARGRSGNGGDPAPSVTHPSSTR